MVVHDMRNPTSQIEYLLQDSLKKMNDLVIQLKDLEELYSLHN